MLELIIERLKRAGVDAIVINAYHLPDQIEAFLKSRKNLGLGVDLLDTGGGLKKASSFFDDGEPFFVHNVDVISDVDLGPFSLLHVERKGSSHRLRARPGERTFPPFRWGRASLRARETAKAAIISDSERMG